MQFCVLVTEPSTYQVVKIRASVSRKPAAKKPLDRHGHRWGDHFKLRSKPIVDRINLAQGRNRRWSSVNMVLKRRVPQNTMNFISCETVSF